MYNNIFKESAQMRKALIMLVLMGILALSVSAVTDVQAFYVDIPTAQKEIDDLTTKNENMTTQNEEMKAENDELALANSDLEGLVREAYIVLEKLNDSAGELYTLFDTVNDADQKRQVNDKMIENRKMRYQLDNKKEEFLSTINDNKTTISNNNRYMSQNNYQIAQNERRIEILQASIELSQNEGTSLDSAFSNADTVKSEVDALLAK